MDQKAILMCTCSGMCPSMKDINFMELAERIRLELPDYYMLMHPRLCEEDGENLMGDLLRDDVSYVTVACKEEKQEKLLRDGFAASGVAMSDETFIPISLSFKDTDDVFEELRSILEDEG